jgi:hypothetical protein
MNLRRIASKLQTALCMKGKHIKIDQYQSYSERAGRMVTKFVLKEKRITPTGKQKDFVILETYQLADVVKELARMYGDA